MLQCNTARVVVAMASPMFDCMTEMQQALLRQPPGHSGVPDGLPATIDGWAVFLDVDGTIVDIAETPDAVVVEEQLPSQLALLSDRLGGALAVVTGRELAFLDTLLSGLTFSAAGLHGAEMRLPDGSWHKTEPSPRLAIARSKLEAAAAAWPGIVVEDKGASIAAHFRLAPQFEGQVEAIMSVIAAELGSSHVIQRGKFVVEIRPRGHDKGNAVTAFMAMPPFLGRRPLAIGDDVTDEAMFAVANDLGGLSVKVGPPGIATLATARLDDPAAVRSWIASVAEPKA